MKQQIIKGNQIEEIASFIDHEINGAVEVDVDEYKELFEEVNEELLRRDFAYLEIVKKKFLVEEESTKYYLDVSHHDVDMVWLMGSNEVKVRYTNKREESIFFSDMFVGKEFDQGKIISEVYLTTKLNLYRLVYQCKYIPKQEEQAN